MSTPNPIPAGASTSDILTALKNLVLALNNASQTLLAINGTTNLANITIPTIVTMTSGRICEVAIIVAGSTPGTIYDGTSLAAFTKPLSPLPNTVGVFKVNMPASFGIFVVPGLGQTVTVSYS